MATKPAYTALNRCAAKSCDGAKALDDKKVACVQKECSGLLAQARAESIAKLQMYLQNAQARLAKADKREIGSYKRQIKTLQQDIKNQKKYSDEQWIASKITLLLWDPDERKTFMLNTLKQIQKAETKML